MKLTDKEIVELRIKCMEPYINIGSKVSLTNGEIFQQAELAWIFATKIINEAKAE